MSSNTQSLAAEIREELSRVLLSGTFKRTKRLQALLAYCVEHAIEKPGLPIKEYTLGVEVLGKPTSFDPRLDPVVRVDAHRLRAKLEQHYRKATSPPCVKIRFPERGYVPIFEITGGASGNAEKAGAGIRSLVLLPLANLSGTVEDGLLCDGLAEELIEVLVRFEHLRVMAWNSVRLYRGKVADLRRIGKELDAEAAIEGYLQRADGTVRIGLRLVRIADGAYLWTETFDCGPGSLLPLREDLRNSILDALRPSLAVPIPTLTCRVPNVSPEVCHTYLRGRHHLTKRTATALENAVACFEEVIRANPRFAGARAGLAAACVMLSAYGDRASKVMMPRAREEARRALRLDKSDAEARTALGAVLAVFDLDWLGAEREFQLVLASRPGHAQARLWFAQTCLVPQARFEEAFEEMRIVGELDPLFSVAFAITAWSCYAAGRSGEARQYCRHALELEPHFHLPLLVLGSLDEREGRFEQALEQYRESWKYSGGSSAARSHTGRVLARLGRKQEALEVLSDLRQLSRERHISAVDFAMVHLGLGEEETALDYLYRAYGDRSSRLMWVGVDPFFERLRGNERYRALMRRLFPAQR